MAAAAAAKVWDAGAEGHSSTKVQGHLLPRTRVSAEKFTGTVVSWKGKYGWIKPGEEIAHEKAAKHNGNLFVGLNDLEGRTSLQAGAPVEFHICEDDDGLGAEEVVQTGPGAAGSDTSKGKGKGKSSQGGSWYDLFNAFSSWAASKGKGGVVKAWQQNKGTWKSGSLAGKGVARGFDKTVSHASAAGKGNGQSKNAGGHTLPKTRITAEKFTGTVKAWKGKYGWIEPAEEVKHEKASKNQGSLFVSMSDLESGVQELTVGATVEFHISEDAMGLNAEEVVQH